MALIGQIRNNLWIVVVLIGLAMAGFILMEMTRSDGSTLFGGSPGTMGSINGETIDITTLNERVNVRNNPNVDQLTLKNAIWNEMVNEALVKKEADDLGLSVSEAEMEDLLYDPQRMSDIIRRDFSQPGSPMPDMEQLLQIKDLESSGKLNPQFIPSWLEEKRSVARKRLEAKLFGMASKAIYTPKWMAEKQYADRNGKAKIAYVRIPFSEIENSEIALEDKDFEDYLAANGSRYEMKTPTQTISYVTFDVKPTSGDSTEIKEALVRTSEKFERKRSNEVLRDKKYFTKEELNAEVADNLFEAETGTVFGPYVEDNKFKMAKLEDRMIVPDSVSARHILRNVDANNPSSAIAAKDTIEMIKGLLETGTVTFDSLAAKYGMDGTSAKGGDLGTFEYRAMVEPFANYCFFEGKEGEYGIVKTQFGIHLVEVTKKYRNSGKEGVKVAYVEKSIKPSSATTQARYKEASKFALDNRKLEDMRTSAKSANLDVETSQPLDENGFFIQNLGSGNVTRAIVKWANEARAGEVSPTVYQYSNRVLGYKDKYVVAALEARNEAGMPSVASMRNTIKPLVTNEKKGERIAADIKGMDLASIASKYEEIEVDSASVAFNEIRTIVDAKLVAAVYSVGEGQLTEPVVGSNGVYVGQLISKPAAGTPGSLVGLQKQIAQPAQSGIARSLLPALKDNADITDKRNKFY